MATEVAKNYTNKKIAQILLLSVITIQLISCSNTSFDDIEIGMTYEEVESQLGKPTAIERGVNQLEVVYSKISSEIAQCRNRKNLLFGKIQTLYFI